MEPISRIVTRLPRIIDEEAAEVPQQQCLRCGGTGFMRYDAPVGDPNFGKVMPCSCRSRERSAARASRFREMSRLGPLASKRFEDFQHERGLNSYSRDALSMALSTARDYAAMPSGWLVLTGPSASGKTHLAAAIANEVLDREEGALWIFVPDFLDHLRTTFNPQSEITYDELFTMVRDAPVLVLDDLGANSSSPWADEKLYQILSHRYDARLPTVITTSKLIESFEGRMRSRLSDPDVSRVVAVVGYASEVVNRLMGLSYELILRMTFENFNTHPYSPRDAQRINGDAQEINDNLAYAHGMTRGFAQRPSERGWLLIMGRHGAGKTHLAAAMANDRMKRGLPTLFIVTPDLLDALRASFGGEGQGAYDKVFYEVRSAPFLILDDFGTQSSTPWAKEKLYQVLNYRYNAQLPTVITTNQTLENIDPPLQSRMSDKEYCSVLAVLAPDYRRNRGGLWKYQAR